MDCFYVVSVGELVGAAAGDQLGHEQSEVHVMQQLPGIPMGSSSDSDSGSSSGSGSESDDEGEPSGLPYQPEEDSNLTPGDESNLTPFESADFVQPGEEAESALTFGLLPSDDLESLEAPAQVLEGLDIDSFAGDAASERQVLDALQLLEEDSSEQMAPTTDLSCLDERNDEPENNSLSGSHPLRSFNGGFIGSVSCV